MGTDELWLGPEISAAQQFGLISQDRAMVMVH
jgi:hypothetical protein